MRRYLGLLLVLIGLVLMTWPILTWAYGLYWQKRLASDLPPINTAEFREERPDRGMSPPIKSVPTTKKTNTNLSPRPEKVKRPPTKQTPLSEPPEPITQATSPVPALPKPPTRKIPRESAVPGGAFARLWIKRIDLDAMVVEGVDRFALRRGPGHIPNTGLPGDYRNCAIAAHRDGWFERLREVRSGDPVWLEMRDNVYKYTVESRKIVTPDRGDLLNQGPNPVLTLITCTGPGYPHSQYRLLVFCRLRAVYPREITVN